LTLGEFASHRLSKGGLAIFCKPHFRQSFLEAGRYESIATEANTAPPSPSNFRPSGVTLFSDEHEPVVHVRKESRLKDFDSGHPQEFKIGTVSGLAANKCTACAGKVFPFCKLETTEGLLYHADWCVRRAAGAGRLSPGASRAATSARSAAPSSPSPPPRRTLRERSSALSMRRAPLGEGLSGLAQASIGETATGAALIRNLSETPNVRDYGVAGRRVARSHHHLIEQSPEL